MPTASIIFINTLVFAHKFDNSQRIIYLGGNKMTSYLVGHTGFVGGNLAAAHGFDGAFNSKNIKEAYGAKPDLLIYSGLPAAKYLANVDADGDNAVCMQAADNIRNIAPKRLVLISTVDVYAQPHGVDEDTAADTDSPDAYGRNRALLEQAVRTDFEDALIVRLPGLFGKGLKKNFLYDMATLTPSMLKEQKYTELAQKSQLVAKSYSPAKNGFFALTDTAKTTDKAELRNYFSNSNFNSLCFTDSRAEYQFYNLAHLWADINTALSANLHTLNIATQPTTAAEIYTALTGNVFINTLAQPPVKYDMHTLHGGVFGKDGSYLYSKNDVISSIKLFMEECAAL